jgi:uncharacterized membrane protein (UPF0127 family)
MLALGCASQSPPPESSSEKTASEVREPGPPIKPSVRRQHPLASLEKKKIAIGNKRIDVYIADSQSKTTEGLMFISDDELADDEGMIFIFEKPAPLSFWMRNTLIPLDIAYLDESGKILNIRTMQPLDEETKHPSAGPAKYAVEMKAGWFERNGIQAGERVDLSALR